MARTKEQQCTCYIDETESLGRKFIHKCGYCKGKDTRIAELERELGEAKRVNDSLTTHAAERERLLDAGPCLRKHPMWAWREGLQECAFISLDRSSPGMIRSADILPGGAGHCILCDEVQAAVMAEHANHVQFANDMYAILVDPVENEKLNEVALFERLKQAAIEQRQALHDVSERVRAAEVAITKKIAYSFAEPIRTSILERRTPSSAGAQATVARASVRIRAESKGVTARHDPGQDSSGHNECTTPAVGPNDLLNLAKSFAEPIRTRILEKYKMSESQAEFPKVCEFCGEKIGTRIDLDWHGLGNCAPICARCKGSGIEPKAQATGDGDMGDREPGTPASFGGDSIKAALGRESGQQAAEPVRSSVNYPSAEMPTRSSLPPTSGEPSAQQFFEDCDKALDAFEGKQTNIARPRTLRVVELEDELAKRDETIARLREELEVSARCGHTYHSVAILFENCMNERCKRARDAR